MYVYKGRDIGSNINWWDDVRGLDLYTVVVALVGEGRRATAVKGREQGLPSDCLAAGDP